MKLIFNFKKAVIFLIAFLFWPSANAAIESGIYYFENEVETFSPCKSDHTYWATGSDTLIDRLRNDALKTNLPFKGALFLKVEGRFSGSSKESEGYAREYDGFYEIERVISVRPAKKTDCRLREQK